MYNDIHIGCGGDILYCLVKEIYRCDKCHDDVYSEDEIEPKTRIMKVSNSDVACYPTVRETR